MANNVEANQEMANREMANREMANRETEAGAAWQKQLLLYAGNDPTVVSSLCSAFLEEVPSLLTKINTRLQTQNTDGLHQAVHTLKSCLSYVASEKEVLLASELEAQAKQDRFVIDDVTRNDFAELEITANQWVARVRQYYNELNPKPLDPTNR